MKQLDLDVFIDGWRKEGQDYIWIQQGRNVAMPKLREVLR